MLGLQNEMTILVTLGRISFCFPRMGADVWADEAPRGACLAHSVLLSAHGGYLGAAKSCPAVSSTNAALVDSARGDSAREDGARGDSAREDPTSAYAAPVAVRYTSATFSAMMIAQHTTAMMVKARVFAHRPITVRRAVYTTSGIRANGMPKLRTT